MKTTKTSKTNARSRIIFFAIALTYNLLLGLYLKDFLVLSPMFTTFYLLSALPTLFFVIRIRSNAMRAIVYIALIFVLKIRSAPMRAIVYIVLFFVMVMSIFGFAYCSRLLPIMTMLETVVMLMYLALSNNSSGKDKLLTKTYVLAVSALIVTTMFFSYNFVFKPEAPYLTNGGATLWDTQTEELADEICAGCETDEEKVIAFYSWIISNFEYDHDYYPIIQYFDVRKTLRTKQGLCFDFAHLFAAFCRIQNIPCYAVDGISYTDSSARHTWNRVYYNGSWWDMDLTNDTLATKDNRKIYGFRELESIASPDKDYYITKIY